MSWADELWHGLEDRWSSSLALIAVALVGGGATAILAAQAFGAKSTVTWVFTSLAGLLIVGVWRVTNYVPRTPKNAVGFVVAIATESDQYDRQLRSDFIRSLQDLLISDRGRSNFALVAYSRRMAARITDLDTAITYLRKSRARFMVYGRARQRKTSQGETHILNLTSLIEHSQVSPELQIELATEFGQFLPRELVIRKENDVFAFELTSEWFDVGTRYIVGVAAMLSGELTYAERLLLSVREKLSAKANRYPLARQMAKKLPQRLEMLYTIWLNALIVKYLRLRTTDILEQGEIVVAKMLALNPANEPGLLFRSMCHFVLRRDLPAARRDLYALHRSPFGTWRFSEAFLLAYEGKIGKAAEAYRRAFKARMPSATLPVQVEEFIQIVLTDEPDRVGLHFAAGLINLESKHDYVSAKSDFEQFLAGVGSRWPQEVTLAREYLRQAAERASGENDPAHAKGIPAQLIGHPAMSDNEDDPDITRRS